MARPKNPDLREDYRKLTESFDEMLAIQAIIRANLTATVGLCLRVAQAAGVDTVEGVSLMEWFTRTRGEEIDALLAKLDADGSPLATIVREHLALGQ